MSSRILPVRLALLLALFLSPAAALAQTWTVTHAAGAAVMDESSKLTFEVRNTGTSRRLSEVTFGFSGAYDMDSAEAPPGWTASVNRSGRRITFTAIGSCPSTTIGLAPGASQRFSMRVVAAATTKDLNTDSLVAVSTLTYAREHCNAFTFTAPNLRNLTWMRHGLSASIQVFPRMLSTGTSVVAQVVVENRSTTSPQSNIDIDGPTPIGTANFTVQGVTPATHSLAQGQAGVFIATATATSNGTAIGQVVARNGGGNSVTSPVAQALQVDVHPLATALDVTSLQAFPGDVVSLRMMVTNTSSNTYGNIVPRAPIPSGTASTTLVSGPVPASVASLAPGASAQFIWQYRVNGSEGAGYAFQGQVDATLSNAQVATDSVVSPEGRLVLIRLTANPAGVLPGNNRLVRYTVENRSTESISKLELFRPTPSLFGAATQPAGEVPTGWTATSSTSIYTWTGGPALLPGRSLTVGVLYATVGNVTYDTPLMHRMRITRNGNQFSRLDTVVTVITPKLVPEVQSVVALSGDGRNTLIWNNPTDHSGVVVLRAAGAAPNTPPVAGTTYVAGETLGNAQVAYADELSIVSRFVDTGVTNGTEYVYRLYNFDDQRRYSPGIVPTSLGLKARPQARGVGAPLWCYNVGLSALNQPITEVGVGTFSAFNNSVIANRTNTANPALDGDERWRPVALQGLIGGRFPVVPLRGLSGQYLLVGTQDGYMYALNAQTGAVLWRGDNGQALGKIQSLPVTQLYDFANAAYKAAQPRDLVFFATRIDGSPTGNKVIALDGATGQRVWLYQPNDLDMVSGGMLVDYTNNRLVVVARSNGNTQPSLRILNTLTGQEVARLALGDIDFSVVRLPATHQALVTANDGTVSGVGLTSMQVEWSMKLPGTPTNFARPQGRGFLATLQSGLVQYYLLATQADGTAAAPTAPSWSTPVPGPTGAFVYLLNASSGRVYVGSSDGKLHELDLHTGVNLKQVSLGTVQRIGMPTVDNTVNRLHVGTQDGRVCAFQVPFQ
jgi:outer membrane protein assembly factor BamB